MFLNKILNSIEEEIISPKFPNLRIKLYNQREQ